MCFLLDCVGAYDSIRDSHNRSTNAQKKLDLADAIFVQSEDVRAEVDKLIQDSKEENDKRFDENDNKLDDLKNDLNKINGEITELNDIVSPCPGDLFYHFG